MTKLGTVTKYFEKWIEKLDFTSEALQKLCLVGMVRIIQKVLDMKWEKKEATIPKKTGWYPLLWHFYKEIKSDLRVKKKKKKKKNNNNNNNNKVKA